jgi:hypothetical protein
MAETELEEIMLGPTIKDALQAGCKQAPSRQRRPEFGGLPSFLRPFWLLDERRRAPKLQALVTAAAVRERRHRVP